MKIDIVYQKHSDVDAPCIAKTEIMGEQLLAIGKTWDEAKTRLMVKVNAWVNAEVPAPETVEVESKDEEMDTEFWHDGDTWRKTREIEAGKV
jgi:hypothetical protein